MARCSLSDKSQTQFIGLGISLALVVILLTILFIPYHNSVPGKPHIDIDTITITSRNVSANIILANIDAWFSVKNSRNHGMSYTHGKAYIQHQYQHRYSRLIYYTPIGSLYETSVPTFEHIKQNSTVVRASFEDVAISLDSRDSTWYDDKGREMSKVVRFKVMLKAKIKRMRSPWRVYEDVQVDFSGVMVVFSRINGTVDQEIKLESSYCSEDYEFNEMIMCAWVLLIIIVFLMSVFVLCKSIRMQYD